VVVAVTEAPPKVIDDTKSGATSVSVQVADAFAVIAHGANSIVYVPVAGNVVASM